MTTLPSFSMLVLAPFVFTVLLHSTSVMEFSSSSRNDLAPTFVQLVL